MRKRSKKFMIATTAFALLFGLCAFACDEEKGAEGESSAVELPVEEGLPEEAPPEGEGSESAGDSASDGTGDSSGDSSEDSSGGSGDGSGGSEDGSGGSGDSSGGSGDSSGGSEDSSGGSEDSSGGGTDDERAYTLTYRVRGEVVKTQEYAAGEEIQAFTPTLQPWEVFLGWEALPSEMPEGDLSVEARLREKENYLQLTSTRANGQTEIRLAVRGAVKLAGLVGQLELGVATRVISFAVNGCLGEVNPVGTGIKFVCSQGENRSSAGELFTLTVATEAEVRLQVEELLAFDENGEIVAVRYEIG